MTRRGAGFTAHTAPTPPVEVRRAVAVHSVLVKQLTAEFKGKIRPAHELHRVVEAVVRDFVASKNLGGRATALGGAEVLDELVAAVRPTRARGGNPVARVRPQRRRKAGMSKSASTASLRRAGAAVLGGSLASVAKRGTGGPVQAGGDLNRQPVHAGRSGWLETTIPKEDARANRNYPYGNTGQEAVRTRRLGGSASTPLLATVNDVPAGYYDPSVAEKPLMPVSSVTAGDLASLRRMVASQINVDGAEAPPLRASPSKAAAANMRRHRARPRVSKEADEEDNHDDDAVENMPAGGFRNTSLEVATSGADPTPQRGAAPPVSPIRASKTTGSPAKSSALGMTDEELMQMDERTLLRMVGPETAAKGFGQWFEEEKRKSPEKKDHGPKVRIVAGKRTLIDCQDQGEWAMLSRLDHAKAEREAAERRRRQQKQSERFRHDLDGQEAEWSAIRERREAERRKWASKVKRDVSDFEKERAQHRRKQLEAKQQYARECAELAEQVKARREREQEAERIADAKKRRQMEQQAVEAERARKQKLVDDRKKRAFVREAAEQAARHRLEVKEQEAAENKRALEAQAAMLDAQEKARADDMRRRREKIEAFMSANESVFARQAATRKARERKEAEGATRANIERAQREEERKQRLADMERKIKASHQQQLEAKRQRREREREETLAQAARWREQAEKEAAEARERKQKARQQRLEMARALDRQVEERVAMQKKEAAGMTPLERAVNRRQLEEARSILGEE